MTKKRTKITRNIDIEAITCKMECNTVPGEISILICYKNQPGLAVISALSLMDAIAESITEFVNGPFGSLLEKHSK